MGGCTCVSGRTQGTLHAPGISVQTAALGVRGLLVRTKWIDAHHISDLMPQDWERCRHASFLVNLLPLAWTYLVYLLLRALPWCASAVQSAVCVCHTLCKQGEGKRRGVRIGIRALHAFNPTFQINYAKACLCSLCPLISVCQNVTDSSYKLG